MQEIISTEGAFIRPMSYDKHPINPIRLKYSSEWTKQA